MMNIVNRKKCENHQISRIFFSQINIFRQYRYSSKIWLILTKSEDMNPSFNHGIWLNVSHHTNNSIMFPVWWRTQRKERRQWELSGQPKPAKKEGKHKSSVWWLLVSTQHPQLFLQEKDTKWRQRMVVQKMCARVVKFFFSSQQSSWIPHQSYFVSNNRTPMEFFDVTQMARTNKYKNKTYVKLCSDGFQYVHLRKYVAISLELVQGCCIWFLPFNLTPCCLYNFLCSTWISHEILKTNLCSCVHSISACSLASRFKWACWPRSTNNTFVRMTSELGLANPLYVHSTYCGSVGTAAINSNLVYAPPLFAGHQR